MAKGDKFYFDNFVSRTELSKKAASYLLTCLENYNADNMHTMLTEMHAIEHSADEKKHEMSDALARAFVTPVDREDLDLISTNLDDVTDIIEEILQKFYIYDIKTVEPSVVDFAKNIVRSCELLCEIMGEFENFKKSKKLRALIIELNDVEEECDRLYLSAMRDLTKKSTDVLLTVSWRNIFEIFESCADACEHASECVASVIMKNT